MNKIPMLERFAAQSLVEHDGELIFSKEKFAELIVRECIEVIDMTHGSKKLVRPDPYHRIVWAIEEHFGVEE